MYCQVISAFPIKIQDIIGRRSYSCDSIVAFLLLWDAQHPNPLVDLSLALYNSYVFIYLLRKDLSSRTGGNGITIFTVTTLYRKTRVVFKGHKGKPQRSTDALIAEHTTIHTVLAFPLTTHSSYPGCTHMSNRWPTGNTLQRVTKINFLTLHSCLFVTWFLLLMFFRIWRRLQLGLRCPWSRQRGFIY